MCLLPPTLDGQHDRTALPRSPNAPQSAKAGTRHALLLTSSVILLFLSSHDSVPWTPRQCICMGSFLSWTWGRGMLLSSCTVMLNTLNLLRATLLYVVFSDLQSTCVLLAVFVFPCQCRASLLQLHCLYLLFWSFAGRGRCQGHRSQVLGEFEDPRVASIHTTGS